MIPYWQAPAVPVGEGLVSVHFLAVMTGLLIGYLLLRRSGLEPARVDEFAFFALVPGVIGSHLGYLFLSGWPSGWFRILNPLAGGITLGGMLFGFAGAAWTLRRWGVGEAGWRAWFDSAARAFPWSWIAVRTGCFLVHDEPGIFTSFPLAVRYPDGPRHDLALYEILWAVVLALTPSKEPMRRLLISFGLLRLVLHFLRPERHMLDLVLSVLVLLAGLSWNEISRRWNRDESVMMHQS